ncbi:MAG: hypothetical protein ACREAE_06215 [Nitrosopumilaceae archaeon]
MGLIAQTIVNNIETNPASLLPMLYISLLLTAVFVIVKVIYKIKDKIVFPIDVGYLVGINALFGIYLLSQIKSGFSFISLINPEYFPAVHLGFAQFFMAAILWRESSWPWYAALGLGIIQTVALSDPLLKSNFEPVFAVPMILSFVLVLMLTESKITQFYQIDAPEFLKYFSKFSEMPSKDDKDK